MKKTFDDYAVVYDISDDKERNNVQKILKNFGLGFKKVFLNVD